jgi:hypothetical protein
MKLAAVVLGSAAVGGFCWWLLGVPWGRLEKFRQDPLLFMALVAFFILWRISNTLSDIGAVLQQIRDELAMEHSKEAAR